MKAGLLKKLDRLEDALRDYSAAIDLKPTAAKGAAEWKAIKSYHYNRGNVLTALQRCPEAVRSFDQAIDMDPSFSQALANRGICLKSEGRATEADQSFASAKEINPDHVKMETTEMNGEDMSKSQFGSRIKAERTEVSKDGL